MQEIIKELTAQRNTQYVDIEQVLTGAQRVEVQRAQKKVLHDIWKAWRLDHVQRDKQAKVADKWWPIKQ